MRLFHGEEGRELEPLQVNDQHAMDRRTDERVEGWKLVSGEFPQGRLEGAAATAGAHFGRVQNDRCCVDSKAPQSHL